MDALSIRRGVAGVTCAAVLACSLSLSTRAAPATAPAATLPATTVSMGATRASVVAHVDPFLGAEAGGNVVPGACVPFGMAKVSADCDVPWTNGWSDKNAVLGISQTHVSGTGGSGKYGNFRLTPWRGELDAKDVSSDRRDESATPGYYTITLTRPNVKAEVTATRMVGFHRYTFMGDEGRATLLLDAGSLVTMNNRPNTQRLVQNSLLITPPNRMEGTIVARGGWGNSGHTLHFSAEFDQMFAEFGTRRVDAKTGEVEVRELETSAASETENLVGWARFLPEVKRVQVKVAVSFVSPARAREHLDREIAGWDFDAVRAAAAAQWERTLSTITVAGGAADDRTKLYTALYRMHQMPVDLTGDNAWWASDAPHYEDFYCLWDTFRGVHPMLLLLAPERQRDMLNSLIETYEHTGWMPDARIAGKNGFTQGGTNGDVLVADAITKGLTGVDYEKAYEALKKNADVQSDSPLHQGRDVGDYIRLGYLPIDYAGDKKDQSYGRSASRTMEYAYNDFCIAQVAAALGKHDDAERYLARSQGWKKLWDDQTQAIRPRYADGRWMADYDRTKRYGGWQDPFFQANGWTYSTYVPHDAQGLIDLLGGDAKAVDWLDAFFDQGQYDQGNEPGFLAAFLYVHAGRPDRTSGRVREILATKFKTGVRGLPGNDDAGAESAWIVSATIGLYPNAGQPYYYLTAPVFPQTTLRLGERTFTIDAPAASPTHRYIASATLNGQPLHRAWLTHAEITAGGTLRLELSEQPTAWARDERPYSVTKRD